MAFRNKHFQEDQQGWGMMKKKGSPKRSFQITFRNVQEFQKDKKKY